MLSVMSLGRARPSWTTGSSRCGSRWPRAVAAGDAAAAELPQAGALDLGPEPRAVAAACSGVGRGHRVVGRRVVLDEVAFVRLADGRAAMAKQAPHDIGALREGRRPGGVGRAGSAVQLLDRTDDGVFLLERACRARSRSTTPCSARRAGVAVVPAAGRRAVAALRRRPRRVAGCPQAPPGDAGRPPRRLGAGGVGRRPGAGRGGCCTATATTATSSTAAPRSWLAIDPNRWSARRATTWPTPCGTALRMRWRSGPASPCWRRRRAWRRRRSAGGTVPLGAGRDLVPRRPRTAGPPASGPWR